MAFVLAAAVLAAGVWWVADHFARDPSLHVRASAAEFEPWPSTIEVIDTRTVMGGPVDSSNTAPLQERFYVLVRSSTGDLGDALDAAVAHLNDLGWTLDPPGTNTSGISWFASSGWSPRREWTYVGALSEYLDSGAWMSEDEDAGRQLRAAAGDQIDRTVLVQVFAIAR